MRSRFLVIAICMVFAVKFSSCYNHHYESNGDMSISVKESDDEYRFSASYDRSKSKAIQNFIADETNNSLFDRGNIDIDATTTMDDDTKFYIRAYPGRLKIEFDKEENSQASYERVKDMCEGIKEILREQH